MKLDEKLYRAMVMDREFPFAEKTEKFLTEIPVVLLLDIYNAVTEIENMEYGADSDKYTEEQYRLLGKIFYDTSLDRYVDAFGEEWVKAHTKHVSDDDLYITLHPFGFITTMNRVHVTDKIMDYLEYEESETVSRLGCKALTTFMTGLMWDYEDWQQGF